tara:strand:+ start:1514 stop:1957 length:444 start_codon:yes stop_codon:yes gene_type:complete
LELSFSIYSLLLIAQISSTWFMVGLIWLIQIVSYPLFNFVGDRDFISYHHNHVSRITPVVGFVMLVEVFSAISLLVFFFDLIQMTIILVMIFLLVLIWVSTAFFQLQYHMKLLHFKNLRIIRLLIYTNWVRTFAWTIKGILCWGLFF